MSTPSVAPSGRNPAIAVVIATKGRPTVLAETLESLSRQTFTPAAIIVVISAPEDAPPNLPASVKVLVGPTGTTFQRNRALRDIPPGVDFVAYFDDDMELHEDYLERAAEFIRGQPEVAAFSGNMVADGHVTRDEARCLVRDCPPGTAFITSGKYHTLHGCNMVIRRALLEREIFDENLPLYAFGEDYDISIRLKAHGVVGRYQGCIGAHLQARGGRVHEVRRGYSVVANNWYFLKKGSVHLPLPLAFLRFWWICLGKTLARCLWYYLRGDRSVDWLGRAKGCLLALADIFRGRSNPNRILEI